MTEPRVIEMGGRGVRGESIADVLRRTGQYGVLPSDTDAAVMSKLNRASEQSAEIAQAIAAALITYTFGYIGVDDPLPPADVQNGEGYVYTQGGRVYGAINNGGTGSVKFEILTAAAISDRGAVVTDTPYNADETGSANSSGAFESAIAANRQVVTPQGTYRLNTSVPITGNLSWHNLGNFIGSGSFSTSIDFSGFNYSADFRKIQMAESRGSASVPMTDHHSVGLFSKHSNVTTAGLHNPSLVGQAYKHNTTPFTVAQAAFFESIDKGGNGVGRTDFVEGVRAHGIGEGGNAYGLIALGQVGQGSNTPNAKYAIGVEGESIRTSGPDAPEPMDWTSADNIDTPFNATVRYGVKALASFLVNPYSEVATRCGFLVGNSFAAQGATRPVVDFAGFATIENGVPYGLYVRNTTFAAISIPNNQPIRAVNADGTSEPNILSYSADNVLDIGLEAKTTRIHNTLIMDDLVQAVDDAGAIAAGVPYKGLYLTGSILKVRTTP